MFICLNYCSRWPYLPLPDFLTLFACWSLWSVTAKRMVINFCKKNQLINLYNGGKFKMLGLIFYIFYKVSMSYLNVSALKNYKSDHYDRYLAIH